MPTSQWANITPLLDIIMDLSPRPGRVLDVGVGFGKFGFLCKEYLTFWDRPEPNSQVRVDGIEAFPDYLGPIQQEIYNSLHIGDARDLLPRFPDDEYDLVLLIDVLEHFTRGDGLNVLSECRRIGKVVIVCTPSWFFPQQDAFGNPYERHRSLWCRKDFRRMGASKVTHADGWLAVFAKPPYALPFTSYYRLFRLKSGISALLPNAFKGSRAKSASQS